MNRVWGLRNYASYFADWVFTAVCEGDHFFFVRKRGQGEDSMTVLSFREELLLKAVFGLGDVVHCPNPCCRSILSGSEILR